MKTGDWIVIAELPSGGQQLIHSAATEAEVRTLAANDCADTYSKVYVGQITVTFTRAFLTDEPQAVAATPTPVTPASVV